MSVSAPSRRVPGISFHSEVAATSDLPRMDVAAFAGFAARGPLHVPVPVESYPDFVEIFGDSYRLAWDAQTATWQTACLAPAVRAFFTQGGQRCWIVRVAGPAAARNRFPLAGLLQTRVGGYEGVAASARCPGSWSDDVQVSVALQLDALGCTTPAVAPGMSFTLDVATQQGHPLQAGEMLQVDAGDGQHLAYVVLAAPDLVTAAGQTQVTATPARTHWFRRLSAATEATVTGTVQTVAPAPPAGAAATLDVASLTLDTPLSAASGDWLRLDTGGERIWLLVAEARAGMLQLAGAWAEGAEGSAGPFTVARVLRLQVALQVRQEPGHYRTLSDMGCAAPHPRFLGYLPDDATLFDPGFGQPAAAGANPAAALWAEVRHPRFDLSMDQDEGSAILPLGLQVGSWWRQALPTDAEALVRDGLLPPGHDYGWISGAKWASFLPTLFLDPHLRDTGQQSLLDEANHRLYLQREALTGVHALLPVAEVSLIAVPDAAQRGWLMVLRETALPTLPPDEPAPPDPCASDSPFIPWAPADAAETPGAAGTPSIALAAVPAQTTWQLLHPLDYDPGGLLAIQEAVARLAAARGDVLALLGMPKHYRTADALQHQRDLVGRLRLAGETTDSYVALYHPWLVTHEGSGVLVHTHPAGGVAGLIAARSRARGAWVAPANELLRETLATIPALPRDSEAAFHSAGINPIRRGARGYLLWGAYTQSNDPELEDVNVRRLLILLRRLALSAGDIYVFAPHSPAFRRRVQQQFEQLLARLFTRGAFAGQTPAEAYRVVVDDTVNTPATTAAGQFIVELRVAPSQPVTFITVRLVQTESGQMAVQETGNHGG